MTSPSGGVHLQRPRTDDIRHPARMLLRTLRSTAATLVRRRWNIEIHGSEGFPQDGPVVVVPNHIGWLDGPLMTILSPRPVHTLTKREMFHGPLGAVLSASGQIPLFRDDVDPRAVRTAVRVLREGGVVGMFPEGTRGGGELSTFRAGAAYLAMVTGARMVPLAMLGTRLPGGASGSLPPAGSRIAMTYGAALEVPRVDWPRRKADVGVLNEKLHQALRDTLRGAEEATGMNLPGPLPDPERARDRS